ncbi:hypothetical protein [Halegenticoccus tardaugens]|uniref:hypothetical protein n=1 Tax=Halegenticoccus tardaugens TaxID=2071624 RepID=UPI0013E8F856|nr:hypothetical protein [Halegenticoccus tardaugens]
MLGETIEGVASRRKTLALFNYEGSDRLRRRLDRFFSFHNVTVEDGGADPNRPRNCAVLYDAGGVVAASSIDDLRERVHLGDGLPVVKRDRRADDRMPAVLSKLDDTLFTVSGEDERLLRRVSRDIATLAVRTGDGALRTGLQRLSSFAEGTELRQVHERAADRGVDVHVYGRPDATPDGSDRITYRANESAEVARTWFVVYDGGGRRPRMAALVAEERDDGYHGFWTLKPYLVESVDEYLAGMYA